MPTITSSSKISLCLRHRILSKKVPDHWEQITNNKLVPADQLAIVICDIWDDHWCKSAAERVNSMAKKTNETKKVKSSLEFFEENESPHKLK